MRYYIRYPRDFANEYTVYACASGAEAKALGLAESERVSRTRAIERGWTRPNEARKTGEQWYGGFVDIYASQVYVHDIQSALAAARENTSAAAIEAAMER